MGNRLVNGFLLVTACSLVAACVPPNSGSRQNPASSSSSTERSSIARSAENRRLQSHAQQPQDLLGINSLVILPVEFNARTRDLGSDAVGIDSQLETAAERELDLKVFNKATFGKALPPTLPRNEAIAWAKRVGADAVLVTRLQNFIERSGSALGGDPGTVHFEMTLVRVSDLRDVWTADYHFRDEALSDNIFRLGEKFDRKSGPGWKKAHDVLEEGFSTALKDLATKRFSQFSVNG